MTATADSLHVGHFHGSLSLMNAICSVAGNPPIALLGGGTTMVGDPSGKHRYAQNADAEKISTITPNASSAR